MFGLYLDLDFKFLKLFGLWLDLDWVLKIQDRIRIAKYDSPLISGSLQKPYLCKVNNQIQRYDCWLYQESRKVVRALSGTFRNL